ncbi:alpha-glucan family phosphorylase [Candidatus Woesearchaeota archaeon]|nr:alpha-glucan family phosphorylase [Candidatus Woesearchaeota archaeon]
MEAGLNGLWSLIENRRIPLPEILRRWQGDEIPIYSGGLGVLSGCQIKAAADMELPMIVMVPLYDRFFLQNLATNNWQSENYVHYNPRTHMSLLPQKDPVTVRIQGREVAIRAWHKDIIGRTDFRIPLIGLDTREVNNGQAHDEQITGEIYKSDDYYKIVQRAVLGIGGARVLEKLGYDPDVYHINEGHGAFLILELLRKYNQNLERVREKVIFTTHTPVPAGHDVFEYRRKDTNDGVEDILGDLVPPNIRELAGKEKFNLTALAISGSRDVNAVSGFHAEISANMDVFRMYMPRTRYEDAEAGEGQAEEEIKVNYITNGVHGLTWIAPEFRELYDSHIPGWRENPTLLERADAIPNNAILRAHSIAKSRLVEYINMIQGQTIGAGGEFDPDIFTMGFARRVALYKRGDLIFYDIQRLIEAAGGRGIQIVMAGKAHPSDTDGKGVLQRILHTIKTDSSLQNSDIRIRYIPDYNMMIGALLTSGCDAWLNTPVCGQEASGTSGEKAAQNGVPHISTPDGWWKERMTEGGFTIGPAADCCLNKFDYDPVAHDLYSQLEHLIMPWYYNDPTAWAQVMKGAIKNGGFGTAYRMMKQYEVLYDLEGALRKARAENMAIVIQ